MYRCTLSIRLPYQGYILTKNVKDTFVNVLWDLGKQEWIAQRKWTSRFIRGTGKLHFYSPHNETFSTRWSLCHSMYGLAANMPDIHGGWTDDCRRGESGVCAAFTPTPAGQSRPCLWRDCTAALRECQNWIPELLQLDIMIGWFMFVF